MCHRHSFAAGCADERERGPGWWRDAGIPARPTAPTAATRAERAATRSLETMGSSLPLLVEYLVPSKRLRDSSLLLPPCARGSGVLIADYGINEILIIGRTCTRILYFFYANE